MLEDFKLAEEKHGDSYGKAQMSSVGRVIAKAFRWGE